MIHPAAATGGDDSQFFGIGFEQAGDKIAAPLFQTAQHADFVFESRFGVRTVIIFEYPAIKTQVHGRPQGIFDF
jgi:hypothetical protein